MWASIQTLWTSIVSWFATSIPSLEALFWNSTDGALTFLGTCCVISIGIGVVFLIIRLIQNFVSLRA